MPQCDAGGYFIATLPDGKRIKGQLLNNNGLLQQELLVLKQKWQVRKQRRFYGLQPSGCMLWLTMGPAVLTLAGKVPTPVSTASAFIADLALAPSRRVHRLVLRNLIGNLSDFRAKVLHLVHRL